VATTKQYALSLYDAFAAVSSKLGYDVRQADLPLRTVVTTTCVLLGGVLRILFTKNLATDAEMNTVFTNIKNAEYPQLPFTAPVVDENNPSPAPPDLGA
jgi:hypothetical protein